MIHRSPVFFLFFLCLKMDDRWCQKCDETITNSFKAMKSRKWYVFQRNKINKTRENWQKQKIRNGLITQYRSACWLLAAGAKMRMRNNFGMHRILFLFIIIMMIEGGIDHVNVFLLCKMQILFNVQCSVFKVDGRKSVRKEMSRSFLFAFIIISNRN